MPFNKLIEGYMIRLDPRDPPPSMPGVCMVGEIVSCVWPVFTVQTDPLRAVHFRADKNEELAVRVLDGSLWEIAEVAPPEPLARDKVS